MKICPKKRKKNMTSDKIKRRTPIRKPLTITEVCIPSNVASRITSLHHKININNKKIKPYNKVKPPEIYLCIYKTPPVVIVKAAIEAKIGHGLTVTI